MRTPGYGITPDRFVRVAHLLPRQCGNVAVDNHTFVNALLWMCRTGAPWRDLPECYGKWVTVYQRFDRWSGVLLQCLFDRFGSVFPQCGLMVFPGVVIVSR